MKCSTSPRVGFCFAPAPILVLPSVILLLLGCASVVSTDPGNASRAPVVPPELEVPSGNEILYHTFATGVQIYSATSATNSPTGFAWTLKAPEAALFDASSNAVGSHYAGPTWELDQDGSKVSGVVMQRVPSRDATAIPWLLLKMKTTEGTGQFCRLWYSRAGCR